MKTNVVNISDKLAPPREAVTAKEQNAIHREELILERKFKRLARDMRNAKGRTNTVDVKTLQAFLTLTMDLIPLAKTNYRQYRSDRSIYALNGLVNQARELMNDLRQLKTGKKQHAHIVNKIILPNLQVVMQSYLNNMTELRQNIDQINDKKRRESLSKDLKSQMTHFATIMKEISDKMQETLAEYLVG